MSINNVQPLRDILTLQELSASQNTMRDSNLNEREKPEHDRESDMKSLLLREGKLQKRLQAIAEDIRGGLDPDSEERAVQLENREALEEIERVSAAELASVRELIAAARAHKIL